VDLTQTEERIAAFRRLPIPPAGVSTSSSSPAPRGWTGRGGGRRWGISRGLAAFHLDRLIADGLLVAEYRRLTAARVRAAGRPAKITGARLAICPSASPSATNGCWRACFAQAFSSTDGNPLEALLTAADEVGARSGARPSPRRITPRAGPASRGGDDRPGKETGLRARAEGKGCLVLGNLPL